MNINEFVIETLKTLLTLLGVVFTDVSVSVDEKMSSPRFVVSTPDSSILIGEQGTRLLALNHLVKRIVEKKFPGEPHSFMVDVNDFQKKHIDEIRAKAHMLAERARYFKSSVEMDPMSSYERMIVHAEFTDSPDITTESSGYGKDRHLVLKYREPVAISE
ncbi:MAG: Jag protein [Parcubacteria group bacterium GW2011_GWA2_47_7]|nr:MAG: Jag protein [Parcubacteria group bacterium GW2011_GWA2_47_7]